MKPEEQAHLQMDEIFTASGWTIQDRKELHLDAGCGIAICEFSLHTGFAGYF